MNKSSAQNFVHLLEEDIKTTRGLINQLKSERETLQNRDIESLQQSTDAKTTLLSQLDQNRVARESLLEAAGFPQTEQGFNQFISKAPPSIQKRWNLLKEQLAECKELNLINGQIIHRGETSANRLLDILRGQTIKPGLYDEQGTKNNDSSSSHSFAKA